MAGASRPELLNEAVGALLAEGNADRIRVWLFVTGDVFAARTRDFLERNRLPHLARPVRVEELTEKINRVLAEFGPAKAEKTNAARK